MTQFGLSDGQVTLRFSEEERERRLVAVRNEMIERDIACLVLAGPENIYYLSGLDHQGYFALTLLIVPLEGPMTLVARLMEATTIAAQTWSCVHEGFRDDQDAAEFAAHVIQAQTLSGGRIAIEQQSMYLPAAIWEGLKVRLTATSIIDGSGIVESLRAVKSPEEINFVRRAAEITSLAMHAGIEAVAPGAPQSEVAAEVSAAMIRAGSEHPGFVPLIRPRDMLFHEHVTWQSQLIRPVDAIFMEFSASKGRYHAPMTRMAYVGEPPAGTARAAAVAAGGLEAVREALYPGASSGDVYSAWQRVMDEELGHDRYRRHHCGYMVGIGYPPSWVGGSSVVGLRAGSNWEVKEGMTFHVLSWLMGQQPADFVLSDTMLVTEGGGEILTDGPRTPILRG